MGKNIIKQAHCAGCGVLFGSRNRGGNRGWTRYCSNTCRGKHDGFKGGPKASRFRRRYGIDLEDYSKMLEGQLGVCALCDKQASYDLYVDHCHTTGLVRGLLCARCNNIVGVFDQLSPDEVERYQRYARQAIACTESGNVPAHGKPDGDGFA